jgi:DNA replication licensing factor MCM3
VQQKDAAAAEEILRFALYKEVLKRQRRKKRKLAAGGAAGQDGEEEESEEEESDEEEPQAQRMPMPAQRDKAKGVPGADDARDDPVWGDRAQDVDMDGVVGAQDGKATAAGQGGAGSQSEEARYVLTISSTS